MYPLNDCYFLIESTDQTGQLNEGGKTILDLSTALNFFAADFTLGNIERVVEELNKDWNSKYAFSGKKVSCPNIFS